MFNVDLDVSVRSGHKFVPFIWFFNAMFIEHQFLYYYISLYSMKRYKRHELMGQSNIYEVIISISRG